MGDVILFVLVAVFGLPILFGVLTLIFAPVAALLEWWGRRSAADLPHSRGDTGQNSTVRDDT